MLLLEAYYLKFLTFSECWDPDESTWHNFRHMSDTQLTKYNWSRWFCKIQLLSLLGAYYLKFLTFSECLDLDERHVLRFVFYFFLFIFYLARVSALEDKSTVHALFSIVHRLKNI